MDSSALLAMLYCKYTIFFPRAGLLGSLFSFLQFFASPLIGTSSDILGRKPVLVTTMVSDKLIIIVYGNLDTKTDGVLYSMETFSMHMPLKVKMKMIIASSRMHPV